MGDPLNTFFIWVCVLVLSIPNFTFSLAGFEPIRQRAIIEFNEQIIPVINERFVSLNGRSSAYQGALERARQALNASIVSLEAEYRGYWTTVLQLESIGMLTKNQAEYDWLLSQVKDIVVSAKKNHAELQNSINSQFRGLNGSLPTYQVPLNTNNIKVVIVTFLMRVRTATAWILLNDLEKSNYLF